MSALENFRLVPRGDDDSCFDGEKTRFEFEAAGDNMVGMYNMEGKDQTILFRKSERKDNSRLFQPAGQNDRFRLVFAAFPPRPRTDSTR